MLKRFIFIILSLGTAASLTAAQLDVCSNCTYTSVNAALSAASDGDVINLLDNVHTETEVDVVKNVTIQGQGAGQTVWQASGTPGAHNGLLMVIYGDVTIRDITLRDAGSWTGAIVVRGDLEMVDAEMIRCNPGAIAVYDYGVLSVDTVLFDSGVWRSVEGAPFVDISITNSTFQNNDGDTVWSYGLLDVSNSLFLNNSGNGVTINDIRGVGDRATLINNTFVGNETAILNKAAMTMRHNTVASNQYGYRSDGIPGVIMSNNLFAYNSSLNVSRSGITAYWSMEGGNLSSDNSGDGFAYTNTDPLLAALDDNGGPNHTAGLLAGSPALNAGVCHVDVTVDQRGAARDADGLGCDIGAFEGVVAGSPMPLPPKAYFVTSTSGLVVNYTDTSFDPDGQVVSWEWTFPDGSTSTDQNPSFTHSGDGFFNTYLTITDNDGFVSQTGTSVFIETADAEPEASFTFSVNGLTVDFTDTSTDSDGTVSYHRWFFGDGGLSNDQHPSHTYAAPGTYTVVLGVRDNDLVTDSVSVTLTVGGGLPNDPPTADFTYSAADLAVDFSDASSDTDGQVVSWVWDFGDGNGSGTQNPSHIYAAGGTYTVALTVTDNGGETDTVSYAVTVTAPPPNQAPTADFTYSVNNLSVDLTDASSDPDGTVVSWDWDFGDGNGSTSQNPSYTYASAGTYTVTLTVTDDDGASHTASATVTVTEPPNQAPVADFTYSATNLSVDFTDTSSDADGTVVSWDWDFGDGGTSTSQDPSYIYGADGSYTVTLTVTDDDGATHSASAVVAVSSGGGSAGYALNSEGNIFLQNDAVVDSYNGCVGGYGGSNVGSGDVIAGGTVNASSSATVGTITENSAPGEVPVTAPFGSSGNLDIQGLVELQAGDYVCNNLTVFSGGTLRGVGGQVRIYVLNNFTVQGNGSVEAAGDYPGNMVFYGTSGNDQFTIQSNTSTTAIIHAPNRRVTIQSNGVLYGQIFADYIELQTNARVHYDTSIDTGCN